MAISISLLLFIHRKGSSQNIIGIYQQRPSLFIILSFPLKWAEENLTWSLLFVARKVSKGFSLIVTVLMTVISFSSSALAAIALSISTMEPHPSPKWRRSPRFNHGCGLLCGDKFLFVLCFKVFYFIHLFLLKSQQFVIFLTYFYIIQ